MGCMYISFPILLRSSVIILSNVVYRVQKYKKWLYLNSHWSNCGLSTRGNQQISWEPFTNAESEAQVYPGRLCRIPRFLNDLSAKRSLEKYCSVKVLDVWTWHLRRNWDHWYLGKKKKRFWKNLGNVVCRWLSIQRLPLQDIKSFHEPTCISVHPL